MTRSDYQRDYRQQYKQQAKRVNLTYSLSEHRQIARAAKAAGLPVASYVKQLSLGEAAAMRDLPEDLREQLADLDRVIRTIANNVNQMARHSHRIGHVLDEQEVFLNLHALSQELRRAITKAAKGASSSEDDLP